MLPLLLACASTSLPIPAGDGDPLVVGDPLIDSIQPECRIEDEEWRFVVRATAWTGGGRVWMAVDTDNFERHRLTSEEAAGDGSSDRLEAELDIVADWRDAVPNSSTRWQCADQDRLSFLVAIYGATGSGTVDCRTWGAQAPQLWETDPELPQCTKLWVDPDAGDTGDTGAPR